MNPNEKIINKLHELDTPVKKYFNKAQRNAMAISAHSEYIVAARGTGKSEGIDARKILQNIWSMPGSTGAMLSPTYAKAWGNTLPAICTALSRWGYVEGVHYFVGRRAPKDRNFKLPKRLPLRDAWNNCIHFWNGTIMVVLSFNQGMSANSMSLDWIIGPEAKFLSYDKIKSEVNPANRGNRGEFGNSPWHHSVLYTTDMPTSKMGKWILDKEKEMNVPHINYIRNLYRNMKKYELANPQTDYTKRMAREYRNDLHLARQYQPPVVPDPHGKKTKEYTVFYAEYDIFDNLEVVGEDFIWQMHRDSPPLIWRTAFLNERLFRVPDCFYSALNDDIHFYIPNESGKLSDDTTEWRKISSAGCMADGDLDFTQPLHIAIDSNSAISTMCVAQPDHEKRQMKTLKSFFVKTPKKLQDLVQEFCDHYRYKLNREIVFYYDHTFTWTSGNTENSYRDTIVKVLENNNWNITDVYVGQAPQHSWKHLQIDKALKGDTDYFFPVFNLLENEFLKIAMEQTGIKQGKNGFEKDKSPEKLPDTPDNPDEHKTHITDAWDTLFYGINFHYREPSGHYFGGIEFLGKRE